jgi:hypothetical protein
MQGYDRQPWCTSENMLVMSSGMSIHRYRDRIQMELCYLAINLMAPALSSMWSQQNSWIKVTTLVTNFKSFEDLSIRSMWCWWINQLERAILHLGHLPIISLPSVKGLPIWWRMAAQDPRKLVVARQWISHLIWWA